METGRIIKIISNQYEVLNEQGEHLACIAMGKLRKHKAPVVGDVVKLQRFDAQIGIQKILPRKMNCCVRQLPMSIRQSSLCLVKIRISLRCW